MIHQCLVLSRQGREEFTVLVNKQRREEVIHLPSFIIHKIIYFIKVIQVDFISNLFCLVNTFEVKPYINPIPFYP